MGSRDDVFKHCEIDEADTELLIEMWKHFHPKDDPQPIDKYRVFLNKKYPEVSPYQLAFAVAPMALNGYWHDRFYVMGWLLKVADPIQLMYKHFCAKFKAEPEPPAKEIAASDEKPKRAARKKAEPKKK
jgi:hypothetical protein